MFDEILKQLWRAAILLMVRASSSLELFKLFFSKLPLKYLIFVAFIFL